MTSIFAENINCLASVRGRLGSALSSWLLYGTGGVDFIDTGTDFTVVSADGVLFTSARIPPIRATSLAMAYYKIALQPNLRVEGSLTASALSAPQRRSKISPTIRYSLRDTHLSAPLCISQAWL